ncbi:MAG TPA: hypothetical protein VF221_12750 [Chloroflexota bacterium]
MQLIFERGDRTSPTGHALIYFTDENNVTVATYVTVPPIQFDLTSYLPGFLTGAMQGLDLGNAMVATPLPPIPEEVAGADYLRSLAERRQDDLVFAGAVNRSDPMRLAADASEAAREYGELYGSSQLPEPGVPPPATTQDADFSRYAGMSEQEKLNELTMLTGRLRDSMQRGGSDPDIERQMRALGETLPAKYRVSDLITAATVPGERGQRLAQLHLERSFKLYNEDYLDLDRIDREIEAIGD